MPADNSRHQELSRKLENNSWEKWKEKKKKTHNNKKHTHTITNQKLSTKPINKPTPLSHRCWANKHIVLCTITTPPAKKIRGQNNTNRYKLSTQQSKYSSKKTSTSHSSFCNGQARQIKGWQEQCTHTKQYKMNDILPVSAPAISPFVQQHKQLLTIFWCTRPSAPGKRPQTGTWMHVSQHAAVFSKLKPWWWEISVLSHSSNSANTKCGFKSVCLLNTSRFIYRHSKNSVRGVWWDVYNSYSASPFFTVNPSPAEWLITGQEQHAIRADR